MTKNMLTIIVPAHNEEGNLSRCVSSLLRACRGLKFEILLVDDVSSDNTPKIVDDLSRKYRVVRAIHRKYPNGFGRAIKTGLENSRGSIVMPFMADMSDDPNTIPRMVREIEKGYDIVVGSRFIRGGRTVDYPYMKYLAHRIYNKALALVFMKNIKDFSNAFKAYRKSIFKNITINSDGFEITSEMILKPMVVNKVKILEVPTIWRNRKSGKAKFTGLYKQGWRYGRIMLEALRLRIER
ncbi:MAG: glycosyltransferase family 2 protein [Candidatus Aenigmarchaeota archaeon]|nr:glycosyltransferase family 2 protein [Candidatus Aenigmarchaeota archaeon]